MLAVLTLTVGKSAAAGEVPVTKNGERANRYIVCIFYNKRPAPQGFFPYKK